MRAVELVATAKEQLHELTGLEIEGVTRVEQDGDGWIVTLVALELSRTPDTMDVLGAYEVVVGDDGDVETFRRVRRFHRAATEED